MSLFSKIKNNITHGGVDVRLVAPANIPRNGGTVPVQVTITAKSEPHSINDIVVRFMQEAQRSSNNTTTEPDKQLAEAHAGERFDLQAGESKTVTVNLTTNDMAAISEQLSGSPVLQSVIGTLGKLQSAADAAGVNQYYVDAVVDVEGISLDPSDRQYVNTTGFGETASGINIHL